MIAGVADTHAALWYLLKNPSLSAMARRFMDDAAAAGEDIVVSPISLAEIVYLVEKNRLPASAYQDLKNALADPEYVIAEGPFHGEIVEAMLEVPRGNVPDRIVAATGMYFGVPVISRDGRIRSSSVKTIGNNILDFTGRLTHTESMSDHATLRDAMLYFADFQHCKDFMVDLRWPDGKVTCPRCGGQRLCWVEKQRLWKCYEGHKQPTFTLKTGTIFEDSPIALEKWLPAVWLLLNCKNGISSYEIARDLGVTQKTAWFMLGRIRLAMQDEDTGGKLGGPGIEIEADETFIGGKARNMHPARRNKMRDRGNFGKTIVSAVLERHGKVRATVVSNRRKTAIQAHLRQHVEPGSTVYTDELLSYDGLDDYTHQVINHAESYVDGQIHTNGMENFWALLKRGLKGTYVAVEPFHLFRYVDEQAFRFNSRQTDDVHRFVIGMKQIVGRRLTYKQLTGKAEVTQHG